jgi:RES domain-containing protein
VNISAWRIVKRKLANDAFSGRGARVYGGRWNSPGVAMVYAAASQSLAALEILVHAETPELLGYYVVIEVSIEPSFIQLLDPSQLPRDWQAEPPLQALRKIGDDWIRSASSPVLQVPSAIVPAESNFLLNPLQEKFGNLVIGKPRPFHFDPRLTARK